jgi:hypothetical protein
MSLAVDECSEWKIVEKIGEVLPHVGVPVLAQTLVVEPVHLANTQNKIIVFRHCSRFLSTSLFLESTTDFFIYLLKYLSTWTYIYCTLENVSIPGREGRDMDNEYHREKGII